jgi:hypothetical protein
MIWWPEPHKSLYSLCSSITNDQETNCPFPIKESQWVAPIATPVKVSYNHFDSFVLYSCDMTVDMDHLYIKKSYLEFLEGHEDKEMNVDTIIKI